MQQIYQDVNQQRIVFQKQMFINKVEFLLQKGEKVSCCANFIRMFHNCTKYEAVKTFVASAIKLNLRT